MLRRSDPFCAAVPGEAALRVPAAIAFHGPTEMALCHAIGQGEAALTPACALRLRARASMGRSCAGTAGPEGGAVLQQWLLASNYHIPDDHRRVGFRTKRGLLLRRCFVSPIRRDSRTAARALECDEVASPLAPLQSRNLE
eukprot:s6301_g6.t1